MSLDGGLRVGGPTGTGFHLRIDVGWFGRWQRLMLFEMDEPKGRQVVFHVFGG